MEKEWIGWLDTEAVGIIPPHKARQIPRHLIVRTRFVLADQNSALRTDPHDLPLLARARLVAWGHTDPELPFLKTDAPTVSELGTHLIYQAAASWGAPPVHGDIKQAFSDGIKNTRRTYLQPPPGGLKGVPPGSLLEPVKAIYGYADAPRCFWVKLAESAEKLDGSSPD